MRFEGIMPAIATTCDEKGRLDFESQKRLVTYCIEQGVQGLTPLVMGGEFYKFSDEERKRVLQTVVDEANGRVPVLAGVSHSGTTPAVALARHAKDVGADGIVVLPPYFERKEAEASLYSHFMEIGNAVDIPLMIQDAEEDLQIRIPLELVSRLAKECSNVSYIKIEGDDSIAKIRRVRRLNKGRLGIFGGDGGIRMIDEFKVGETGLIAGASTSSICVRIYDSLRNGRVEEARRHFRRLKVFLDFSSKFGSAWAEVEKIALKRMGVISSSYTRQPIAPHQRIQENELTSILTRSGLLSLSS